MRRGLLKSPALPRLLVLSFLSGAALMAAELAAPRLVAPHLGAGLLTWSAVFAVFLGAMALGNALGGRLADRGARRTLGGMFLVSGLSVAAAVPLDLWMRAGALDALSHGPRTLVAIALAFGPGALAVGTIAPALGRAVLAASSHAGRALGAVSAAGAVGSVFGTFITGFLLVPETGTRAIVIGAGAVLLACIPMAATIAPSARRAAQTASEPLPRGWIALAALAGFALLVVEVVAARVAANRLGTSVYTWTSVIGVVLLALGAGNALGGWLADRVAPRRLLGALLLAASVCVASCLWTPALMTRLADLDAPWMLRTLLAVAASFLLPAFAVGTLTPAVVRAALTDPAVDGRVVGRLYAVGAAGAVLGSILTGYLLIPLLQVPLLVTVLALVLAVAAWRLGGRVELPWIGTLVLVGLLAWLPLEVVRDLGLRIGIREDAPGTHVEDSRYFHIGVEPHPTRWVHLPEPLDLRYLSADPLLRGHLSFERRPRLMYWRGDMTAEQFDRLLQSVQELGNREAVRRLRERVGHRVKLLSLDRFVHGFVDLDDPLWLEYEYEILYGALVRELWTAYTGGRPTRCFFIGGGAYTFQRRLLHLYERLGLRIVTAEIDPAVTAVAREHLGLAADARHRIVHDDARTVLRGETERYDFVFGDAFHDLGVPWHLTTVEFAREVRARMTERGVYLVNLIDVFASGRFLGAFLCTLEEVFDHVCVVSMGPRDDHAQETFLVLASGAPISWGTLTDDEGRALDAVVYGAADLEAVRRRAGRRVLTDDHAPVENLLAPVVRLRAGGGLRARR